MKKIMKSFLAVLIVLGGVAFAKESFASFVVVYSPTAAFDGSTLRVSIPSVTYDTLSGYDVWLAVTAYENGRSTQLGSTTIPLTTVTGDWQGNDAPQTLILPLSALSIPAGSNDITFYVEAWAQQTSNPGDATTVQVNYIPVGVLNVTDGTAGTLGLFNTFLVTGRRYGVTQGDGGFGYAYEHIFTYYSSYGGGAECLEFKSRSTTNGPDGASSDQYLGCATFHLSSADPSSSTLELFAKQYGNAQGWTDKNATIYNDKFTIQPASLSLFSPTFLDSSTQSSWVAHGAMPWPLR